MGMRDLRSEYLKPAPEFQAELDRNFGSSTEHYNELFERFLEAGEGREFPPDIDGGFRSLLPIPQLMDDGEDSEEDSPL